VIGAGRRGREQQEDQVDRTLVDRFEIDRALEARETSGLTVLTI